ncbi:YopX family protein [Streptococcus gordonii]|uniref:YopX family protein n=1 Tax=Streptococcus gordonii TaxID=1302 RepID=UPI000F67643B|nr:YopX family protein [Streptococcus gordonii]RSJ46644.1 YopX protein [Streptococcus gordonii]RSJ49691.1 YopX protein [Streptococcus gordonii]
MIYPYRGLSIDENSKGQWQYGYLIEDHGEAFIINEVIEANEQYITIGSWCPVNNESVGRFTGLFDDKLVEIYEKDILRTKNGLLIGVVEYREDLAMWTNSLISYNNFERLCNVASSREIIGNVYQNNELLNELLEVTNDRD